MSETQKAHIEPGIYRHFKGNLYFVLGLAWSRNHQKDPIWAEVIYHPLYQCENLTWKRDISLDEFLENVGRPEFNYSYGPRFVKVMDWNIPNILPGHLWLDPKREIEDGRGTHLTIISICEENKELVVTMNDSKGNILKKDFGYLVSYCMCSNLKIEKSAE